MRYDFVIVGAGPFGATFARSATDAGMRCLIIDKRDHIAGNAYTKNIEGINVHMYGAHIFHTDDESIWTFVNQFADWKSFHNSPRVRIGNSVYSFPINLLTLHQLWGVTTPAEARAKLEEVQIPCKQPKNAEQWMLSQVGREIYELFFREYTRKQWSREPKDLPCSIFTRLPLRLSYDDSYFDTTHQAIPIGGYTRIFENMLEGIDVELGVNLSELDWRRYAKQLVNTGPIDQFFGYSKGRLDYRSLRFDLRIMTGDYQGHAVFNHPDESIPYIRTVEHKYFEQAGPKHIGPANADKSIITFDYPLAPDCARSREEPHYPLRDDENLAKLREYKKIAKLTSGVLLGGRLGEFKYYDMDQAIGSARAKFNRTGLSRRIAHSIPKQPCPPAQEKIDNDETRCPAIQDVLHVYALAHNEHRYRKITNAAYIAKIRLDHLKIPAEWQGEQLAESRIYLCDGFDFRGCEYQGFINARWDEKYCRRSTNGRRVVPQNRFDLLTEHFAPNVVVAPEIASSAYGPAGWYPVMTTASPDIGPNLKALNGVRGLSLGGNGPSIWSNNFICHRDVMSDFLLTWRRAFDLLIERYGPNMEIQVHPSQQHRNVGYLGEAITLLYFSNRRALRFVHASVPVATRLRRRLRRPEDPAKNPNEIARDEANGVTCHGNPMKTRYRRQIRRDFDNRTVFALVRSRLRNGMQRIQHANNAQLSNPAFLAHVIRDVGLHWDWYPREQICASILRQPNIDPDRDFHWHEGHLDLYGMDRTFMIPSFAVGLAGLCQIPDQLAWLLAFIRNFPIREFIEIGTGTGWTTAIISSYLTKTNDDCTCTSIDSRRDAAYHTRNALGCDCPFTFVAGTSYALSGQSSDLCLIDGDHSYASVRQDFENVGRWAKICALHDIADVLCPDVGRFWSELKLKLHGSHQFLEILDHPSRYNNVMGIGVMIQRDLAHQHPGGAKFCTDSC